MIRIAKAKSTAIATLGVDIGKNTFHLVGLDERGAIVLRERLSRSQIEIRLANMAPCLVGMEACVGAHHLGRRVEALGHDVRLMAAKYVRPFCRKQKNDFNDAQAIAEAVTRPTVRCVALDPRLSARARHCYPLGLARTPCRVAACAHHDRQADPTHAAYCRGPRRRLAQA